MDDGSYEGTVPSTPTTKVAGHGAMVVAGITAALLIGHLALQGLVDGPWLVDEHVYLGTADAFLGRSRPPLHGVPYYRWAYSVLLVPVRALPFGPVGQFRAVPILNAALLAAAFPVLRRLLALLVDADPTEATLGALVASLHPAVWVYGGFALAEPLIVLLVPVWLLTVAGAVRIGRPWWLVVSTLALYAAHQRLVVAVVVGVIVLAGTAWSRADRRGAMGWGAACLALGVVTVNLVDRWLVHGHWSEVADPTAARGGTLGVLRPSNWGRLLGTGLGGGWALVVSGGVGLLFGLRILLGLARPAAAARAGRSNARRDVIGGAEQRWMSRAVLLLGAGLAALSVAFMALGGERADRLVYGRYVEVALPPVLAVGVVGVLRRGSGLAATAAVTIAVLLGGAALLAVLPATESLRTERVPVLHAPGLALLTSGTGPLAIWRATAVSVAVTSLVAVWATARLGWCRVALAAWVVVLCVGHLSQSGAMLTESRHDHQRAVAEG